MYLTFIKIEQANDNSINYEQVLYLGTDAGLYTEDGNIDLVDDSFNGSVLTLVANTNIANSTVNSGSVIVNGGKSKIYNSTLTGCDVAITQNNGELEIISNIITNSRIKEN